jgi:RNA polymerase sigma factor (TIGR02999 family)
MDLSEDVTVLLASAQAGDKAAADRVFSIIYGELHRIAAMQLRGENPNAAFRPTTLVNEAYVRLAQHTGKWNDRAHFFAFAARVMRHILVDEARRRQSAKRGSGIQMVPLDDLQIASDELSGDILVVDELLTRLFALHERQARVVEMIWFAGLSDEEAAKALGVSVRTVHRDWATARAWLHGQLTR